jgi:hypothetical protein
MDQVWLVPTLTVGIPIVLFVRRMVLPAAGEAAEMLRDRVRLYRFERQLKNEGIIDKATLRTEDCSQNDFSPNVLGELAEMWRDQVRIYRYERQLKCVDKAERMAMKAGITVEAIPMKTLFPLLETASLDQDENLHEAWAKLLSNPAKPSVVVKRPPNVTPLFSLFLSLEACEAVIGDIQERYTSIFSRLGKHHASVWFWKQVIASLATFAWASLKRASGIEKIYRMIGR